MLRLPEVFLVNEYEIVGIFCLLRGADATIEVLPVSFLGLTEVVSFEITIVPTCGDTRSL